MLSREKLGDQQELRCRVKIAEDEESGNLRIKNRKAYSGKSLVVQLLGLRTHFHCRGHGFNPWSGKIPQATRPKKRRKEKRIQGDYLIIRVFSRCILNMYYTSEVVLGLHIVIRVPTLMKHTVC